MGNAATVEIDIRNIQAGVRERLAEFQSRYPLRSVDVEGRTWTFRRIPGRSVDRLPAVMVPGIQGGGDMFFEAVLAVGEVMPMITVSAPDIENAAEMDAGFAGFLRELRIGRANLVGSSMGGYLVQSFVLGFPDVVEQLVLANGFFDVAAFIAKLPPVETIAQMDPARLVDQNLSLLLATPDTDEGQVRMKAAVKALVGPVQTLENYKSRLLLVMAAQPLAAPPIPPERVMIIDDDHDPMLPAQMRDAVRERFAKSVQHAIDGGGHLPAIQRPVQFADLLRRHFAMDAS